MLRILLVLGALSACVGCTIMGENPLQGQQVPLSFVLSDDQNYPVSITSDLVDFEATITFDTEVTFGPGPTYGYTRTGLQKTLLLYADYTTRGQTYTTPDGFVPYDAAAPYVPGFRCRDNTGVAIPLWVKLEGTNPSLWVNDKAKVVVPSGSICQFPVVPHGGVGEDFGTGITCSATENPASGACFHGDGTLLLESGATKKFSELALGERIKTSDGRGGFSFNPVLTLPHKNNTEPAAFVALTTETGKKVDMTSDHIIPKCDEKEVTAGELMVGDCVLTADGKETLMEVSSTAKTGVFTAITQDKFIVVDGIIASSYSKDSDPAKPENDYIKYRLELEEKRERRLDMRLGKHKTHVKEPHA